MNKIVKIMEFICRNESGTCVNIKYSTYWFFISCTTDGPMAYISHRFCIKTAQSCFYFNFFVASVSTGVYLALTLVLCMETTPQLRYK